MKSLYKIIHTACHTEWGDLEKRIFNESVWMEKNGHKVIIVAPVDSPLFSKAKEHGFKVYGIKFRLSSMIKDYKLLKKIFSNEKPDIVNTHENQDSRLALLAAKKAGVPCRILSRHISTYVTNSWYNRMIYKKLSHYIFTTCDHTTKHLQKVFKLKDMQIFSMPSGIIEPDQLLEKTQAREELAKALCLDPETRFIGFVGKIARGKGISTLLKAFEKARPKLLGYHVAIIGEGTNDHITWFKSLARDLQIDSQIHFTGFKEDIWPCYRALDCVILPKAMNMNGVQEIPRVILEAMICECPVIGSRTGSIVDVIDHKKTGLLFEAYEPTDLAEKILETLQHEDETRERIDAARDLVKKQHTIDTMGRNIIRIYRLHQVRLDRQPFAKI